MAYSGNPKDYSVAVVYGGTSGEREVSLNSGVACADAFAGAFGGEVARRGEPSLGRGTACE